MIERHNTKVISCISERQKAELDEYSWKNRISQSKIVRNYVETIISMHKLIHLKHLFGSRLGIMDPITEEQLLAMNSYIIKYDEDNRPGIRDGAGSDLYFQLEAINYETDLIMKAALAIYTANSHVFNNGNKRTAFELADVILGEYGYYIDVDRDELIKFSCWVGGIIPDDVDKDDVMEEIIKWLKARIRELEL